MVTDIEVRPTIFELSPLEQRICIHVGLARRKSNKDNNVHNGKIGNQSNEQTDIEGFSAEYVFAKYYNLCPDFSNHPRSGGEDYTIDGGITVDVKQTRYESGHLVVPQRKAISEYCDIYSLVIGTFPVFRIVGWAYRDEATQRSNLRIDSYGNRSYWTKQGHLYLPETLNGIAA